MSLFLEEGLFVKKKNLPQIWLLKKINLFYLQCLCKKNI